MLNQEVIDHLINPGNAKIMLDLERIKKALNLLNNPQDKYQVIHITGTNGKGSTAAFIETGLIHSGYKIGKFTSPHIKSINESIALNGHNILDKDLNANFSIIQEILQSHELELSPFEYLTIIMFYYFAKQQIEYLILEVGMGGENDATNVIKNPLFSIITNISLEHTKWLGNTLAEIAHEKSGIIKNNLAIIADNTPELIEAVKQRSNNYINVLEEYPLKITLDPQNFTTHIKFADQVFNLSLFGKFQAYNFLCAYAVFSKLNIPQASINYAASHTKWPGRLQMVAIHPVVILDATHNEAGAYNIYNSLLGLYKPHEVILITSILGDKNITAMCAWLAKISNTVIFSSIENNPRALPANRLAELVGNQFKQQYIIDNPNQALDFAKSFNKKLILITGSLYLLSYFT